MLPSYHVGFGALFAAALFTLFPGIGIIGAILVFLSTFLGDVDHYLVYVFREKKFSLKRAYRYWSKERKEIAEGRKTNPVLFLFHTIEFSTFLLILSFSIHFLMYVALGLLFHMIFDYIDLVKLKRPDAKHFSLIIYYKSRKH